MTVFSSFLRKLSACRSSLAISDLTALYVFIRSFPRLMATAASFGAAAAIVGEPMPSCIDAKTGFPYSIGVIKHMGMDAAVGAPSGQRR
jgi:hypothetical protein